MAATAADGLKAFAEHNALMPRVRARAQMLPAGVRDLPVKAAALPVRKRKLQHTKPGVGVGRTRSGSGTFAYGAKLNRFLL